MARSFLWLTGMPSSQFGLRATVRGTVIRNDWGALANDEEWDALWSRYVGLPSSRLFWC